MARNIQTPLPVNNYALNTRINRLLHDAKMYCYYDGITIELELVLLEAIEETIANYVPAEKGFSMSEILNIMDNVTLDYFPEVYELIIEKFIEKYSRIIAINFDEKIRGNNEFTQPQMINLKEISEFNEREIRYYEYCMALVDPNHPTVFLGKYIKASDVDSILAWYYEYGTKLSNYSIETLKEHTIPLRQKMADIIINFIHQWANSVLHYYVTKIDAAVLSAPSYKGDN
jgi:hypothetical protein